MAKRAKSFGSEPNPHSQAETSNKIRLQTEDFLRQGGIIQTIPNGVSGQIWKPNKQTKPNK